MKSTHIWASIFACFLFLASLAPVASAAVPVIQADQQYFDIKSGLHVLKGNVTISHNGRVVTAGEARTNMLEVWASDNVTFTQDDISFRGDSVYVNIPNNTAKITGNVSYSDNGTRIQSQQVEYDWSSKIATFTGQITLTQNGATSSHEQLRYHVIDHTLL
ncbi:MULTISPECIES: LptA/OstA family protein [Sporomusaceae]|uniref:LptA/OstA family protein n=1 Tax=Sporomusaceae TaxID=1843490 RepID=UPI00037A5E4F|nr:MULTISPECIES: LptA/OstA family protein [Sporomusaceae]